MGRRAHRPPSDLGGSTLRFVPADRPLPLVLLVVPLLAGAGATLACRREAPPAPRRPPRLSLRIDADLTPAQTQGMTVRARLVGPDGKERWSCSSWRARSTWFGGPSTSGLDLECPLQEWFSGPGTYGFDLALAPSGAPTAGESSCPLDVPEDLVEAQLVVSLVQPGGQRRSPVCTLESVVRGPREVELVRAKRAPDGTVVVTLANGLGSPLTVAAVAVFAPGASGERVGWRLAGGGEVVAPGERLGIPLGPANFGTVVSDKRTRLSLPGDRYRFVARYRDDPAGGLFEVEAELEVAR